MTEEIQIIRKFDYIRIIRNMQIVNSKVNIIEKVLRDKQGRLVRARFQVYEIAGRIKARLLDFTYI